jgi:hypothetical protein
MQLNEIISMISGLIFLIERSLSSQIQASRATNMNSGKSMDLEASVHSAECHTDQNEDHHTHYSHRSPWLRAFILGASGGWHLLWPCCIWEIRCTACLVRQPSILDNYADDFDLALKSQMRHTLGTRLTSCVRSGATSRVADEVAGEQLGKNPYLLCFLVQLRNILRTSDCRGDFHAQRPAICCARSPAGHACMMSPACARLTSNTRIHGYGSNDH